MEVRWGANWYAGEVLGPVCEEFVRIRFTGYGDEWDEVVETRDVRRVGSRAPGSARPDASDDNPNRHRSAVAEPRGGAIGAAANVPVGAVVVVRDGPSWYAAHVTGHGCSGLLRVHYDGWGSVWDAWVPRDRTRWAQ